MEITKGIFQASQNIYQNNKGSLLRTVIYTIGHFAIAITVLMIVADVSFKIALTDAIVEPIANSIWYFIHIIPICFLFCGNDDVSREKLNPNLLQGKSKIIRHKT